jgi:hypothetical protein
VDRRLEFEGSKDLFDLAELALNRSYRVPGHMNDWAMQMMRENMDVMHWARMKVLDAIPPGVTVQLPESRTPPLGRYGLTEQEDWSQAKYDPTLDVLDQALDELLVDLPAEHQFTVRTQNGTWFEPVSVMVAKLGGCRIEMLEDYSPWKKGDHPVFKVGSQHGHFVTMLWVHAHKFKKNGIGLFKVVSYPNAEPPVDLMKTEIVVQHPTGALKYPALYILKKLNDCKIVLTDFWKRQEAMPKFGPGTEFWFMAEQPQFQKMLVDYVKHWNNSDGQKSLFKVLELPEAGYPYDSKLADQLQSSANPVLALAKKPMKIKLPVKKANKIEPGLSASQKDGALYCAGCQAVLVDEEGDHSDTVITEVGAFTVHLWCSHCGYVSTHESI